MILVTGGAGFIGSKFVAALRQEGRRVVVCDKTGEGDKWRNLSPNAVEDFVHPDELVDFLKSLKPTEVTSILHLSAISSMTERDVDKLIHYNLRLSKSFWQVAVEIGVPFIRTHHRLCRRSGYGCGSIRGTQD